MSAVIASIKHHGESLPVPSDGTAQPFANEHFEGSVFFVHQPSKKSKNLVSQASLPHSSDHWEIQIQGRFKTRPDGQVFAGGQLPKMPFGMNHMLTSMCRMVLNDVAVKSSPGGSDKLCLAMTKCGLLFRSVHPINLPVSHPASQGTWDWKGSEYWGEWYLSHWRQAGFDTHHYYAFTFNSGFLDLDSWRVTNVPGFGSLDLKTCCGKQECELKIFDDSDQCFFQLEFHPPSARKHICDTTWCDAYSGISTVASLTEFLDDLDVGDECEWSVAEFTDELIPESSPLRRRTRTSPIPASSPLRCN